MQGTARQNDRPAFRADPSARGLRSDAQGFRRALSPGVVRATGPTHHGGRSLEISLQPTPAQRVRYLWPDWGKRTFVRATPDGCRFLRDPALAGTLQLPRIPLQL